MSNKTVYLRGKEGELDYRFMHDPDLPRVVISPEMIERARNEIGETPLQAKRKLGQKYGLSMKDVLFLYSRRKEALDLFEDLTKGKGDKDA